MSLKRTRLLLAAAPLAAFFVLVSGCAPKPPGASPQAGGQAGAPAGAQAGTQGARRFVAIPVIAVTVHVGPLTAGNDTAASVVPTVQSTVASQVSGVVARVVHVAGEWVKQGEPVVMLDTAQLKLAAANAQAAVDNAKINYQIAQDNSSKDNPRLILQMQSAQSALDSAQKNYESQKALYDIGGAPASAVDNARGQLQQAQANLQAAQIALDQNKKADVWTLQQLRLAIDQAQLQLQTAELNLHYSQITAPFTGQIAAVNVNQGMYVSQNTAVYIIVSADKQINFNVPPADAPNLPIGSPVQFTYLGRSLTVKVSQAPSAPINGVVPMVAAVPRSFSAPYGAVGTVTYTLTIAHGAIVPIATLQTNEDRNYVFTVENGKAVMRYVTISGQSGTGAAVSGIPDGAQVIMSPPPGLLADSAVQVTSTVAAQDVLGGAPAPGQRPQAVDPPPAGKGAPAGAQGGKQ